MSNWLYFGYDALRSSRLRQNFLKTSYIDVNERSGLSAQDRRKASEMIRDQVRNLAWVGWMVRAHVTYVTRFSLMVNHVDDNREIEERVKKEFFQWSEDPFRCHVFKMHSLADLMFIHEINKTIAGDDFLILTPNGIQGIESDRVGKPEFKIPKSLEGKITDWGFVEDKKGVPKGIVVIDPETLEFQDFIDWDKVIIGGYFDRHDQKRGVSPLLSAYLSNQDLKENFEYALIKLKFSSFIGAVIKRNSATPMFQYNEVQYEQGRTEYEFDLRPGLKLELDPGDEIEFPEAKTPSTQFKNFAELMLQITLKALDIPFSWFDSRYTSYNGMRHEHNLYQSMAFRKQEANRRVLDRIFKWRLADMVVNRIISSSDAEKIIWSWLPMANPFLDPQKEIPAEATQVAYGMNSRSQIMRQHGLDPDLIFSELRKEQEYIAKNLPYLGLTMPGQRTPIEIDIQGGKVNAKAQQQTSRE